MIAFVRFCAIALATGVAPVATAESIGDACEGNPDRIERAICADPVLKATRDQLLAVLATAQDALSDRGDEQLANGQAAWLERTHRLCSEIVDKSLPDLSRKGRSCLQRRYDRRSLWVTIDTRRMGPFQFSVVERFDGAVTSDGLNLCHGMFCGELSYPQIDAPLTPATERWNREMMAWAEKAYARHLAIAADVTSFWTRAKVRYADSDFISVERWTSWSTGETLHTYMSSGTERVHRWLASGRALEAADLFNPATDWAGALRGAATAQLGKQYPNMSWAEPIQHQAADPAHWSFSAKSLIIHLDHETDQFGWVEVPWRDLAPYLVSPLPLALALD